MTTTASLLAGFQSVDSYTPDNLIASTGGLLMARKYTLLAGQNVVRGTVLGIITSGGKVVKSLSASSDGSQTPALVAAMDCDAATVSADKEIECYVRGNFNEHALVLGTAHTLASIREGLRSKGIFLETPTQAV
jgi:hypothetical protein